MSDGTSYQLKFQTVKDVGAQLREIVELKMRGAALAMVHELFEQELDQLCGARFSRKNDSLCHRGGSDPGSIKFQGERVSISKPRVRRDGREVELQTYSSLQGYDILCEKVMNHMVAGVSTRDYDGLLDEVSGSLGLKKSSVSRAFVRASKGALDEINSRNLSEPRFASIMVDGVGFGDRTVIAALGITINGQKMILGLREGASENWEIARDLFENLIARGLKPDQPMLFVTDGSKALKKAIRKTFGQAPIQRCVRHKERNIIQYLPEERHLEFRRRWKKLHGLNDFATAEREYDDLVHWLGHISSAALTSLEEAERETLTVIKLNIPPMLKKTLLSTNALESTFSMMKPKTARVKNWRSGPDQVLRWAATTLLEAETRFNKIHGFLHIPKLIERLEKVKLEKQAEVA